MIIGTAREYLEQIVDYNLRQYKACPESLPLAFNLAGTLFSMHEWVWKHHEVEIKAKFGMDLKTKGEFNKHVQNNCNAFKYIRDLANASKHVTLDGSASTNAKNITDTKSIRGVYEAGIYESGIYEEASVVINDGDIKVDFETCADEVYAFWTAMLEMVE